jgi:hypothetical protein
MENIEKVVFTPPGPGQKVWVNNLQCPSCCMEPMVIDESGEETSHVGSCEKGIKFREFLIEYFSQVGSISQVVVRINLEMMATSALVTYASVAGATRAVIFLNGECIPGTRRRIAVKPFSCLGPLKFPVKVGARERYCINLANSLFPFGTWSSSVVHVQVICVARDSPSGLWSADIETTVLLVINKSIAVLLPAGKLEVKASGRSVCNHKEKADAIHYARKDSKSKALVSAFEKITVAVTSRNHDTLTQMEKTKCFIPFVSHGAEDHDDEENDVHNQSSVNVLSLPSKQDVREDLVNESNI